MSVPFIVGQSFIPKKLGRSIDQNFLELCLVMNGFRKFVKKGKDKAPAIVGLELSGKLWNTPIIRFGMTFFCVNKCFSLERENAPALMETAALEGWRLSLP